MSLYRPIADMIPAVKWWRNLSINQQKDAERKHLPGFPSCAISLNRIYEMWEKEGKPEPQELIPVTKD